ncbi:MAG: alpha/beta fold hydrolase [Burkholderiales bacterium]|nr:alpha/beta fold hydrolase [Burkholderiales bacterium]
MIRLLLAVLLAATANLAAAAPATLAPAAFNNGTAVDESALGKRIPLVLVHGLGGSGQGWENFLQAYARSAGWQAAFKPYTFRYASDAADVLADPALPRTITGLGAAFRDALQSSYDKPTAAPHFGFGNKSLVILAHSMGGLVARSMMQEYTFADGKRGGDRVLHLVTLGAPHQGSPLADAAASLGLQLGEEFATAYGGFIADLAWTNFDQLNQPGRLCNAWLARLNNYAPSVNPYYGNCGGYATNPLRGYYDRITAYAAASLQQPDLQLGYGIFKPGSSAALYMPHTWLKNNLTLGYANDGIVPTVSAHFDWRAIGARKDAFHCDHRYLERGYTETVKAPAITYTDWAFCANSANGVTPTGVPNGWAVQGTIMADIGATFVAASQVQRVMDWAEQAFATHLQPAGAVTDLYEGFQFRHYPATQAYVGVKNGNVYYIGPASGGKLLLVGALAQMLAQAEAAGY